MTSNPSMFSWRQVLGGKEEEEEEEEEEGSRPLMLVRVESHLQSCKMALLSSALV
jgi:hypothetical protein